MSSKKKLGIALGFLFTVFLLIFVLQTEFGTRKASVAESSKRILASVSEIRFPIRELANCASKEECKAFCDLQQNMLMCVNFAEKHGFISKDEAAKGRKMAELGVSKGPGGCDSAASCDAYCRDVKNIRECVAFAKKAGMLTQAELREAEKIIGALDKGAKLPGGCASKASCDVYCQKPQHIRECIDFAEAAGFVNAKEAAMVRKTGGFGPGGCFGKGACEQYCVKQNNMQECLSFAIEYDLMSAGEKEEAVKILAALKRGVKMPNCGSMAACDEYCFSASSRMLECVEFAEAAGFMSEEEIKIARRMAELGLTSGPGGCRSMETCMSYCTNPVHLLECLNFARKMGITPQNLRDFAPSSRP